jgi:hypothetical protein
MEALYRSRVGEFDATIPRQTERPLVCICIVAHAELSCSVVTRGIGRIATFNGARSRAQKGRWCLLRAPFAHRSGLLECGETGGFACVQELCVRCLPALPHQPNPPLRTMLSMTFAKHSCSAQPPAAKLRPLTLLFPPITDDDKRHCSPRPWSPSSMGLFTEPAVTWEGDLLIAGVCAPTRRPPRGSGGDNKSSESGTTAQSPDTQAVNLKSCCPPFVFDSRQRRLA